MMRTIISRSRSWFLSPVLVMGWLVIGLVEPVAGQGLLERLPFGRVSSNFSTGTDTTTSTALRTTVSTAVTFPRPGFALVTAHATDDAITGCGFCEIALGVQPAGAGPVTEVPGTRKTYQCSNIVVGVSGVTGELPQGTHRLHFRFKSNSGSPCQLRQRVINVMYAPFSQ